jgi:ABC-type transport system involved in multi-copper enzyme maturation permease subunit
MILRRALADRRRWLLGWSLGVLGLVVLELAFYPTLHARSADINKVIDNLPASVRSLFGMADSVNAFGPVGYLSSRVFTLIVPLLLLIAGIGIAAGLAGDEERGLLETHYSLPFTRRQLVAQRAAALGALTGELCLVTFVGVWLMAAIVGMDIGVGAIWWASLSAALLTWAVAAITLATAAITGRRAAAIAVASALAVVMYLVTGLADAGIGFFHAIRVASLFTHYDVLHSLQHGTPPWSLLVLVAVTLAGLSAALWGIDRRDLRAG